MIKDIKGYYPKAMKMTGCVTRCTSADRRMVILHPGAEIYILRISVASETFLIHSLYHYIQQQPVNIKTKISNWFKKKLKL